MQRHQSGKNIGCSFCGKARRPERPMVAGPGVFICGPCVQLCTEILAARPSREMRGHGPAAPVACSFCGRPRVPQRPVVAGPEAVVICGGCVQLCTEILAARLPYDTPGR